MIENRGKKVVIISDEGRCHEIEMDLRLQNFDNFWWEEIIPKSIDPDTYLLVMVHHNFDEFALATFQNFDAIKKIAVHTGTTAINPGIEKTGCIIVNAQRGKSIRFLLV